MLVTGDEYGFVRLWDLTPALAKMGMKALRDEEMPCNFISYNAHRRCAKDGFIHGIGPKVGGDGGEEALTADRSLERNQWRVEYLQTKLERSQRQKLEQASSGGGDTG